MLPQILPDNQVGTPEPQTLKLFFLTGTQNDADNNARCSRLKQKEVLLVCFGLKHTNLVFVC